MSSGPEKYCPSRTLLKCNTVCSRRSRIAGQLQFTNDSHFYTSCCMLQISRWLIGGYVSRNERELIRLVVKELPLLLGPLKWIPHSLGNPHLFSYLDIQSNEPGKTVSSERAVRAIPTLSKIMSARLRHMSALCFTSLSKFQRFVSSMHTPEQRAAAICC